MLWKGEDGLKGAGGSQKFKFFKVQTRFKVLVGKKKYLKKSFLIRKIYKIKKGKIRIKRNFSTL